MDDVLLGLDIGGTKCSALVGDAQGRVLAKETVQTRESPGWRAMFARLAEAGGRLLNGRAPRAVGISCGGPLSSARGVILSPPNLPGWDEVPACDYFAQALGAPCFLQNDANACALAEWRFGAGRGFENVIFLTFGTGLGAGLILGGSLYEGTCDMAGEVGHVRMAEGGPLGYGKAGSLEGFCSGGGLFNLSKLMTGRGLTARELCAAARAGDAEAAAVIRESARYLGLGLSMLIDLLNPQRIVIGSIFARAEDLFRPEVEKIIAREALPLSRQACRVVPAQLGEAIGDVAALCVAINGQEKG